MYVVIIMFYSYTLTLQCTMLNYSVQHLDHLDMFNKLLMTSQHYIIYAKKNKCHTSTIPVDKHLKKKNYIYFLVKPQGNETSVVTI